MARQRAILCDAGGTRTHLDRSYILTRPAGHGVVRDETRRAAAILSA